MNLQVIEHKTAIEAACRLHRATRLDLFGSAAAGNFDPSRSDFDFLVEFESGNPGEMADRYLGLLIDLEAILGGPVDLVLRSSIRNPYFLESVDSTRSLLFAG